MVQNIFIENKMYQSWGRFPKVKQYPCQIFSRFDPYPFKKDLTILPYGQGRSYGDVCLNDGGAILLTGKLDKFIEFNRQNGILKCESGVTLLDINKVIIPHGWFLPVTPGTQYVSLGGAIANDVHGKNHHKKGTFGRHVKCFELLRSDGVKLICSPNNNSEWYNSTIGGLGLTGTIIWAEVELMSIDNSFIESEIIKMRSIDDFYEISLSSDKEFEYTVAWLDCLAKGTNLGRGLFFRGNHLRGKKRNLPAIKKSHKINIPFEWPFSLLNSFTVKLFNCLHYGAKSQFTKKVVDYESFFYPLDCVLNWNRLYGRRGMIQYQCVIPIKDSRTLLRNILEILSRSNLASFLAVLKIFEDLPSPGMMSFPKKGVTLSVDFPNYGKRLFEILNKIDQIIADCGGRIYPAKDARVSSENFKKFYPEWNEFSKYIDPRHLSNFWRRVTQQ